MSENRDPSIERLERGRRRWLFVAVVAVCGLVFCVVQGTYVVLSLRKQLADERANVAAARRVAEVARKEAAAAWRRAEEATDGTQAEPGRVIPVEFLFPTDQMYRLFPGDVRRRFDPVPLERLNRPIDETAPLQQFDRLDRMRIDLQPVPQPLQRNR